MKDIVTTKIACVAIITCMLAVPLGMSLDSEASDDYEVIDEDMESCYTTTKNIDYRNSKVNASLAVGTWNGYWVDARDSWVYNFKIGGMGTSGIDCIKSASIDIEGPPSYSEIEMSDLEPYICCAPRSEKPNENLINAFSQLVVDVLLALVPIEDTFEDVWTVATDVMSLIGAGCDHADKNRINDFHYSWEWRNPISETTQQVWIVADLKPAKTSGFEVQYNLEGDFGTIRTSSLRMTLSSPATAEDPSNLTPAERESVGIRTVQREDLVSSASELNLTLNDTIGLLSTDEKEFYFATSAPTCELVTIAEDDTEEIQPVTDILEAETIRDNQPQEMVNPMETYQTTSTAFSFKQSIQAVSVKPRSSEDTMVDVITKCPIN